MEFKKSEFTIYCIILSIFLTTPPSYAYILGSTQLQHIPLDLGSSIVHASSADPYLSILAADGQVITLMLRESKNNARLVISKSTLANVSIPNIVHWP